MSNLGEDKGGGLFERGAYSKGILIEFFPIVARTDQSSH